MYSKLEVTYCCFLFFLFRKYDTFCLEFANERLTTLLILVHGQ